MIHELKTWTEYFDEVFSGKKNFEVRLNDRDFNVGDYLILKEWDNSGKNISFPSVLMGEYTGRECYRRITYVLHGYHPYVMSGYVVMSLAMCDMAQIKEIQSDKITLNSKNTEMDTLSNPAIEALQKMRKGFYLLMLNGNEGYCSSPNYEKIRQQIPNGTIKELLEGKLIRSSLSTYDVFMLTDEGRNYKK